MEVAILSLTTSAGSRFNRIAGCCAGDRGVLKSPKKTDNRRIRRPLDIAALCLPEITNFEVVSATEISGEIGRVETDRFAFEHVVESRKVTRHVRKPRVVERGIAWKRVVIDISGRGVQRILVFIPDAGRTTCRSGPLEYARESAAAAFAARGQRSVTHSPAERVALSGER